MANQTGEALLRKVKGNIMDAEEIARNEYLAKAIDAIEGTLKKIKDGEELRTKYDVIIGRNKVMKHWKISDREINILDELRKKYPEFWFRIKHSVNTWDINDCIVVRYSLNGPVSSWKINGPPRIRAMPKEDMPEQNSGCIIL